MTRKRGNETRIKSERYEMKREQEKNVKEDEYKGREREGGEIADNNLDSGVGDDPIFCNRHNGFAFPGGTIASSSPLLSWREPDTARRVT